MNSDLILESLNSDNDEEIDFVRALFLESFPKRERRPERYFFSLYHKQQNYAIELCKSDGKPIGFFVFWEFDHFIYVEYLAISSSERGHGVGSEVLHSFIKKQNKPIILEVEPPTDSLSQRRIEFYRRNGFRLWDIAYTQPLYRKNDPVTELRLMSYGDIDVVAMHDEIINEIKTTAKSR